MTDQQRLLEKRFLELGARAAGRGCWVYSDFLNLAEQDILRGTQPAAPYELYGGYDGAERRIAVFGSLEDCGYPAQPPVSCLRIAPTAQKFADALTHRDFLGALMHLGVRRETLGDIILHENCGYLFCLESMGDYIIQELTQVRHTPVSVSVAEELPPVLQTQPEPAAAVVSSERVDAVVAAVYRLSRAESQRLLAEGRIYINSRQVFAAAAGLEPGDLISVRGLGRFLYDGPLAETRKGRLRVQVRIY